MFWLFLILYVAFACVYYWLNGLRFLVLVLIDLYALLLVLGICFVCFVDVCMFGVALGWIWLCYVFLPWFNGGCCFV